MSLESLYEIDFVLYRLFLFIWQRQAQVPRHKILKFTFNEILCFLQFILLPLQFNKVCPQNLRLMLELGPQPLQ